MDLVEMLSSKFHAQDFAIFMENLEVYKTKEVIEACKRLKARPNFNVSYNPAFNGIR
jgi:hypothetical protein